MLHCVQPSSQWTLTSDQTSGTLLLFMPPSNNRNGYGRRRWPAFSAMWPDTKLVAWRRQFQHSRVLWISFVLNQRVKYPAILLTASGVVRGAWERDPSFFSIVWVTGLLLATGSSCSCSRRHSSRLRCRWWLFNVAESVSPRRVSSFQAAPVAIINHNEASPSPITRRAIFFPMRLTVDVREAAGRSGSSLRSKQEAPSGADYFGIAPIWSSPRLAGVEIFYRTERDHKVPRESAAEPVS